MPRQFALRQTQLRQSARDQAASMIRGEEQVRFAVRAQHAHGRGFVRLQQTPHVRHFSCLCGAWCTHHCA
jgi:hypothetical protein